VNRSGSFGREFSVNLEDKEALIQCGACVLITYFVHMQFGSSWQWTNIVTQVGHATGS